MEKIYFRIKEKDDLPVKIEELKSTMNLSSTILQNITDIFNITEEERDRVLKTIASVDEWLGTKLTEQKGLPEYKDPVLTSDEISRKRADIEFQTKMLLRKPKKKLPVVNEGVTGETGEPEEASKSPEPVVDPNSQAEEATQAGPGDESSKKPDTTQHKYEKTPTEKPDKTSTEKPEKTSTEKSEKIPTSAGKKSEKNADKKSEKKMDKKSDKRAEKKSEKAGKKSEKPEQTKGKAKERDEL